MTAFTSEELAQLKARADATNAAAVAVIKEKCLAAKALIDEAQVASGGLVSIFSPFADPLRSMVDNLQGNFNAIYSQNIEPTIQNLERA